MGRQREPAQRRQRPYGMCAVLTGLAAVAAVAISAIIRCSTATQLSPDGNVNAISRPLVGVCLGLRVCFSLAQRRTGTRTCTTRCRCRRSRGWCGGPRAASLEADQRKELSRTPYSGAQLCRRRAAATRKGPRPPDPVYAGKRSTHGPDGAQSTDRESGPVAGRGSRGDRDGGTRRSAAIQRGRLRPAAPSGAAGGRHRHRANPRRDVDDGRPGLRHRRGECGVRLPDRRNGHVAALPPRRPPGRSGRVAHGASAAAGRGPAAHDPSRAGDRRAGLARDLAHLASHSGLRRGRRAPGALARAYRGDLEEAPRRGDRGCRRHRRPGTHAPGDLGEPRVGAGRGHDHRVPPASAALRAAHSTASTPPSRSCARRAPPRAAGAACGSSAASSTAVGRRRSPSTSRSGPSPCTPPKPTRATRSHRARSATSAQGCRPPRAASCATSRRSATPSRLPPSSSS